ncbi:MAG: helix-turn-helix transcriptional regulator [Paludibacteraceae bacterium]|nr:helix-turn-helix transcriptional regulator [Paludibacteraceae bacterium]
MRRNLLKAKIVENGLTMEELADKISVSRTTLFYKMSGKTQFTLDEVVKICDVLNIHTPEEKTNIFLA